MTYSLTRILAEVKLLDKKILDAIAGNRFADLRQTRAPNAVFSGKDGTKTANDIKAVYESVQKMVKNRATLKAALVKANAVTKLTIGGVEYTIAEAIEQKKTVESLTNLANTLRANWAAVTTKRDQLDAVTEMNVQKSLEVALGANKGTAKFDADSIKAISDPIREASKVEIIDPIGLTDEVGKLVIQIESFETEVDFALSEANAKTTVEVALL
jgi:hypothetical protein